MFDIDIRQESRKIRDVLRRPRYVLITLLAAVAMFVFYALLLNYQLLWSTLLAGNISLLASLTPTLVGGYVGTTTTVSIIFTTLISLAIGVNVALVVFRLVQMSTFGREGASSIGGMILAVVAPACPACATAIFAVAGFSSFLALLPFNGTELKALSLLLLGGSALWIASQIDKKYCEFC